MLQNGVTSEAHTRMASEAQIVETAAKPRHLLTCYAPGNLVCYTGTPMLNATQTISYYIGSLS